MCFGKQKINFEHFRALKNIYFEYYSQDIKNLAGQIFREIDACIREVP